MKYGLYELQKRAQAETQRFMMEVGSRIHQAMEKFPGTTATIIHDEIHYDVPEEHAEAIKKWLGSLQKIRTPLEPGRIPDNGG